ncbi:uncharacterized protein KY384_006401 [Bacidia gigantensis]|uniref:uncharacterized protein n=1 Tax=Bacidia gigantensis TaxID=2732470 RepID=UPI001D04937C|nr:uncharacterized protein KY384_006401 [Bacidia gigantensis]KAG8528714.1 hypothetical protein KY384_006401 [Bacidia gigantensis]
MGLFGGKSFDPATEILSLKGKVFFVTGGNTGLGLEAIKQLLEHEPEQVFLAARTPSKGEAAVAELKKNQPNANIAFIPLDLSSFDSISSAAQEFASKQTRLDVLMNNAGIMAVPSTETKDGYEIQFGTNHMGHALLTKLLMPTLEATAQQPGADVRIINLTSEGHNFARTASVLTDQIALKKLNPWTVYGYSKLANILFAQQLAAHHPNITSVAVHPGVIKTDLYAPNSTSNPILRWGLMVGGWLRGTVQQGALNQLWAATAPKEEIRNGAYYKPVASLAAGSPLAQKKGLASDLWEYTEKELAAKGF